MKKKERAMSVTRNSEFGNEITFSFRKKHDLHQKISIF
jgi:hypothetical protein